MEGREDWRGGGKTGGTEEAGGTEEEGGDGDGGRGGCGRSCSRSRHHAWLKEFGVDLLGIA